VAKKYQDWYDGNYHRLTNGGVWLRGREINTLDNEEFDNRSFRVIITRLSTYWDTADSFTHKLLYQMITSQGDMYADLAYLPPLSDADVFNECGIPWILGTSSKYGADAFDIVALSNSIVQEIVNIPSMLKRSAIPLRKSERMEMPDIPLVILGGANALYTSSLQTDDPFVDGIFVGEDSSRILQLFSIARECKKNKLTKRDILEKLESVDGFYQPDSSKKTVKYTAAQIDTGAILKNGPVMYTAEQMGSGNLAISEGCPCFCSFCAESWGRKPYRELPVDNIKTAVLEEKAMMALETIELYSFNFNMHSGFYHIINELVPLVASIGLKSQRFDMIAKDPEILKCLHAIGKTSITCGLEGISRRMRKYLHKSLDDKDLKLSLSMLIRAPIRELKIFLIATGKETKEDFDEFCELLAYINSVITMAGRKPRIIFSMTPLVRFPYTPLEKEPASLPLECREVVLQAERFVNSRGFEFRDSADHHDYYLSQIIVRAQSNQVRSVLFTTILQTGFIYYREVPESFITEIEQEMKRAKISREDVLAGLTDESILNRPVSINVNQQFMETQAGSAQSYDDRGYCIGTVEQEGTCIGCGACNTPEEITQMTSLRRVRHLSPEILRKKVKDRNETISVHFKVKIPKQSRGIVRNNAGVAIGRAMMLADERLIVPYHGYESSFVQTRFENSWIFGDDIIGIRFHKSAKTLLDQLCCDSAFIDKVNMILDNRYIVSGLASMDTIETVVHISSHNMLDPSAYINKHSIKHTMRKPSENESLFELTKDGLKKKIIASCSSLKVSSVNTVSVNPLDKFVFNDFFKTIVKVDNENELFGTDITVQIL
jgi:radical SAM superfamily enzyme YgiQ (UPF0313 family)